MNNVYKWEISIWQRVPTIVQDVDEYIGFFNQLGEVRVLAELYDIKAVDEGLYRRMGVRIFP